MKGGANLSETDIMIARYFREKGITSVEKTNQMLPDMAKYIADIMLQYNDNRLPEKYMGRTLEWWKREESEEGDSEAYKFLNRMFEHLMNK